MLSPGLTFEHSNGTSDAVSVHAIRARVLLAAGETTAARDEFARLSSGRDRCAGGEYAA